MKTKKKNIIKITLDILMALTFAVLFNKMAFGSLTFHEVAGLAVGAAIILHMLLNKEWLKGVTKKLFSKAMPLKTKVAYFIDVLLLIAVAVIIVTGILMSKVLFANLTTVHANVKTLHVAASYFSLLLIGAHVGLVWNKVMNIMKKLLKLPKGKAAGAVSTAVAVLLFILGTYNMASTGYFSKVSPFAAAYSEHGGPAFGGFESDGVRGEPENFTTDNEKVNSSAALDSDGTGLNKGNPQKGAGSGEGGNGHIKEFGQNGGSSTRTIQIIYQNLSIMAAFTVLTYYVDKTIQRKRKRTRGLYIEKEI